MSPPPDTLRHITAHLCHIRVAYLLSGAVNKVMHSGAGEGGLPQFMHNYLIFMG